MLTELIASAGLWFLVACAAEFVAVFVEQASAARTPEEDTERNGFVSLLRLAVALLTPGLLLAHAFLVTRDAEFLRIVAMGAPIAAMILGALLGAMFGALARFAAAALRLITLPLALGTLALTIFATLPSIRVLIEAAQNGWTLPT
ncbi:MAG: hypothetical protein R3C16_11890 [Hyphomonadaceae bacterium]